MMNFSSQNDPANAEYRLLDVTRFHLMLSLLDATATIKDLGLFRNCPRPYKTQTGVKNQLVLSLWYPKVRTVTH